MFFAPSVGWLYLDTFFNPSANCWHTQLNHQTSSSQHSHITKTISMQLLIAFFIGGLRKDV